MLKKRLRMVLDFEVTVEQLTDEALRAYYRGSSADYAEMVGNREWWTNVSKQTRLQSALLEDETALNKYLAHVVTTEVDASLDSRLAAAFGVGGLRAEEEILGPLFSRLGTEDEKYYCQVCEDEIFADNTPALDSSFKVKWLRATLEETTNVIEGSLDNLPT